MQQSEADALLTTLATTRFETPRNKVFCLFLVPFSISAVPKSLGHQSLTFLGYLDLKFLC